MRLRLSDASGLTARQAATILASKGHETEAVGALHERPSNDAQAHDAASHLGERRAQARQPLDFWRRVGIVY
jgi:hypothetical protein